MKKSLKDASLASLGLVRSTLVYTLKKRGLCTAAGHTAPSKPIKGTDSRSDGLTGGSKAGPTDGPMIGKKDGKTDGVTKRRTE